MGILAYAALRQVPDDIIEAALLDGASDSAIFWRILLPLTAPLLLAIFVLRLIMAFKTFDLLYILTFGGPGSSTEMAGFTIWRTALRSFDLGTAAAQTVLFAAFVSVFILPFLWFIVTSKSLHRDDSSGRRQERTGLGRRVFWQAAAHFLPARVRLAGRWSASEIISSIGSSE